MSDIKVKNESGMDIDVAINRWGSNGNTGFYSISDGETESWSRSNGMGFVLVVTVGGKKRETGTYWYVKAGTDLTVRSLSDVVGSLNRLKNPYGS